MDWQDAAMTDLSGSEHKGYVRRMFGRIAGRYDLMNRLMTLGQDVHWRKEAIRRLEIPQGAVVLDAGAGTGDIAFQIRSKRPDVRVVASDLTPEMMQVGRQRAGAEGILWVAADAEHLPFAHEHFDGVISGFLLRNVADLEQALSEQGRVLKPGGRMAALDTTPPQRNLLQPFLRFHLQVVIPLLGRIVAGDAEAYRYLPDSTESFLEAGRLAERIRQAGFAGVGFVRRMLGTVAIHWGRKTE
jgi:demethylmenaquinone methyltransferase/2-methoxy-6-polyprenyl-1,4-benzoquinol methylase